MAPGGPPCTWSNPRPGLETHRYLKVKCSGLFGIVRDCSGLFGTVREVFGKCSGLFGIVRHCSALFGIVRKVEQSRTRLIIVAGGDLSIYLELDGNQSFASHSVCTTGLMAKNYEKTSFFNHFGPFSLN